MKLTFSIFGYGMFLLPMDYKQSASGLLRLAVQSLLMAFDSTRFPTIYFRNWRWLCLFPCLIKAPFEVKLLWQRMQIKGRSPVCDLIWITKFDFPWYDLLQPGSSHLKCGWPSCVFRCTLREETRLKAFVHKWWLQRNFRTVLKWTESLC